jgi:hypothetical protein
VSSAIRSAWLPGTAEKWQSAIGQLLQADLYAQDTKRTPSQFAIGVDALVAAGLILNDLRWLIVKGFAEHLIEVGPADLLGNRKFRRANTRPFAKQSRIVMTVSGIAFARKVYCSASKQAADAGAFGTKPDASSLPVWNHVSRKLTLGSTVVKVFNVPATNQERILTAFEEQHWPVCIDDPLPPTDDVDSKRRLRDATARLNRGHERRLIRFSSNGNGRGIRWSREGARHRTNAGAPSDQR